MLSLFRGEEREESHKKESVNHALHHVNALDNNNNDRLVF